MKRFISTLLFCLFAFTSVAHAEFRDTYIKGSFALPHNEPVVYGHPLVTRYEVEPNIQYALHFHSGSKKWLFALALEYHGKWQFGGTPKVKENDHVGWRFESWKPEGFVAEHRARLYLYLHENVALFYEMMYIHRDYEQYNHWLRDVERKGNGGKGVQRILWQHNLIGVKIWFAK